MMWGTRLAPLLSTMSLTWCVLIGGWIWFTPIRYEVIHNSVTVVRYQPFSEISLFGPAPLIAPVLIAAVAVWASWRSHRVVLGFAAFLLAVYLLTQTGTIRPGPSRRYREGVDLSEFV